MKLIHPKPSQLSDYCLGKLSSADHEEVERHLSGCATCRSNASALDETADSFVSSLRDETPIAVDAVALHKLIERARSVTNSTVDFVDNKAGKIVAGCALLEDQAIAGGLGVVYKAYHPILKAYRAIKRPQTRKAAERAQLFARFRREVEAVGQLRHDHIVRALDAGVDDEGPYLVMEYLDGASLNQLVQKHGPLPIAEACELTRQAALGLQAAQEQGLVHRDVKPSNLMLARVNAGVARVVIIDWGLVKRQSNTQADASVADDATTAGATMGTPDYIAPEQVGDAHGVDTRADIYSLGATLYCLLTGKPPFQGRGKAEKLLAHQTESFPPMEAVIPDGLRIVMKKMTTKKPANRYATPAEVAAALKPYCCPKSRLARLLDGAIEPLPPPSPRRRVALLGGIIAAALAVVLCLVSVSLGVILLGNNVAKRAGPVAVGVLGDGPKIPERMAELHPGFCSSLTFLPDGLHAASESGGGSVYVWDLKNRRAKKTWLHVFQQPERFQDSGGVVAASPDGNYLVAGGLNAFPKDILFIDLYNQKTFEKVKENFASFSKMGHALTFAPDSSKLATVALPGILQFGQRPSVRIVEVPSGNKWLEFPTDAPIKSLAFSPDGRALLGGAEDGRLHLWQLKPHKLEREFVGHRKSADQVAFSTDAKRIYSASLADATLRVWANDANAKETHTIDVRKTTAAMTCATFWKDGRALTGHGDGKVVLWDLNKGEPSYQYEHKQTIVTAVAISPDGHHALAALADHSLFLHRLPPP